MPVRAFAWRFASGGLLPAALLVYPSVVGTGLVFSDLGNPMPLAIVCGVLWTLTPGLLLGAVCWLTLPRMRRLGRTGFWLRCAACWLAWPVLWILGEFVLVVPMLFVAEMFTGT